MEDKTHSSAMTPPEGTVYEKPPADKDPELGPDPGHAPAPTGRRARLWRLLHKAAVWGRVEARGITPIPVKERTVKKTYNMFTLWWSVNVNILPITFGMLAPAYGLDLRNASLIILFFILLTTTLPAYLCTLGPKIGMRQMLQARYSFGRYLVSIPVLLNLATTIGFCVIMAVIGGQCLSAVASGNLSVKVGIVITAIVTLFISFCGYSVLHLYERFAWIPALIAMAVAAGCGGRLLHEHSQAIPLPSPPASAVFSYGMLLAGYMIPWACLSSDFSAYLHPDTSAVKIFAYSYAGLAAPPILLMTLGAAIGNAIPAVPAWQEAFDKWLVGGVLDAMLAPAGGFGKFLVVLLSFSLLGNLAATSYSVTLNLQLLVPGLVAVPRYWFSFVFVGVVIPVAIRAAEDFFLNLENFLGLIGYWSSAFVAVVMVEHLWFRGGDFEKYDVEAWNDAKRLPWGAAAMSAAVGSFALVIPSMEQVWWTGPIAETTGDIGFELAFVVTGLLYVPFRYLEKRWSGR